MFDYTTYDLTQAVQGLLFQAAYQSYQAGLTDEERKNPPLQEPLLQIRRGYAESPAWMMVQVAEFMPEPLTVEKFRRRAVYSSPSITYALLEMLASEKWLNRRSIAYQITEVGQAILDQMRERRTAMLSCPLPVDDGVLDRLAELAGQVIEASLQAGDPPGTWCLEHSRVRAPRDDAPAVDKMIQYGADFNAFRDDAHMAAYRAFDVTGHVWEAFGFVAMGQARTAAQLFDQLAYRGWSTEEWQDALDDLADRGWLELADGGMTMTVEGQRVRDEVERLTDDYFFAPWRRMGEDTAQELVDLMQQVRDTFSGDALR